MVKKEKKQRLQTREPAGRQQLTGPPLTPEHQHGLSLSVSPSPQMGFFRRRYREIIEAEKNRKDSDESWDWMDKDH